MRIEFKNGKFHAIVDGKVVGKSNSREYLERKLAKLKSSAEETQEENAALRFPINQRFNFVERLVKMVAQNKTASAIITGDGGLGKSHTVMATLSTCGLEDISGIDLDGEAAPSGSYVVVKGYSTPKGLYRTLYENRNSIVVFDDCDSILKDPDAVNLLKGALDSYETRIISWNSMRPDDELPRSFQFSGGVVFISNRAMCSLDQALKTRSMCVDLSMTLDQKLERMEVIMQDKDFLPGVKLTYKKDALALIRKLKGQAREISLRTLISVAKIRAENDADWEDLATYSLVA